MPVKMIDTIIIVYDWNKIERGYSLERREFVLKKSFPCKCEATMLDGVRILDEYYVVDLNEFIRVVPEAATMKFDSNEVHIPVFAVQRSFRPEYIKR